MGTAKETVESLLHGLPDGRSFEEIQYHLHVIEKVRHGLDAADWRGSVAQEEAKEGLEIQP